MKLRPISRICNAATWAEMCRHLNPFARPGNQGSISLAEFPSCGWTRLLRPLLFLRAG